MAADASMPGTVAARPPQETLAALDLCDGPDDLRSRVAALARQGGTAASGPTALSEQELEPINALIDAHQRAQWAIAWPRLRAALRGSDSPRAQAAAWIVAAWPLDALVRVDFAAWTAGALGPQPREAMQGLVKLSLASRDPVVLGWTLALCRQPQLAGHCDGLSARQWTHASPREGLAWAALLAEEPQAQEEVLTGLARIERLTPLMGQLQAELDRALPEDVPRHLRFGLASAAGAWEGAQVMNDALAALAAPCLPTRMADANRRQACAALGERLDRLAGDELPLRIAARIGERSGWPAERVAARQAEAKAIVSAKLDTLFSAGLAVYSCRNIEGLRDHWRRIGEIGERAWALKRLEPAR